MHSRCHNTKYTREMFFTAWSVLGPLTNEKLILISTFLSLLKDLQDGMKSRKLLGIC